VNALPQSPPTISGTPWPPRVGPDLERRVDSHLPNVVDIVARTDLNSGRPSRRRLSADANLVTTAMSVFMVALIGQEIRVFLPFPSSGLRTIPCCQPRRSPYVRHEHASGTSRWSVEESQSPGQAKSRNHPRFGIAHPPGIDAGIRGPRLSRAKARSSEGLGNWLSISPANSV